MFTQPHTEFLKSDRAKGRFLVDQTVFTDQKVFEQERALIFSRCWLYLGHESEVKKPRDFITREVGGYNLIFAKDRGGAVQAFHNACTHRGTTLVRETCGSAANFTCPYHGWVFSNQGALMDKGATSGYTDSFNDDGFYDLKRPARLENYRGFYFVNFNARAIPLSDYLAEAKDFIDLIVEQSEGGVELSPGEQQLSNGGNWKLLSDNQVDMYHGMILHSSYFDYLKSRTAGVDVANVFRNAYVPQGGAHSRGLGNGHCAVESDFGGGRPVAQWIPAFGDEVKPIIQGIKADLDRRVGNERANRIANMHRNMAIFPNLVITDNLTVSIRTAYPLSPNRSRVSIWGMRTADEDPLLTAVRYRNQLTFVGPGGFAHPDDFEVFDLINRGNTASPQKWHDYSKGMRDETGDDSLTARGEFLGETQHRAWWTQWDRIIGGVETLEG